MASAVSSKAVPSTRSWSAAEAKPAPSSGARQAGEIVDRRGGLAGEAEQPGQPRRHLDMVGIAAPQGDALGIGVEGGAGDGGIGGAAVALAPDLAIVAVGQDRAAPAG